jgi:DNA-binding transcriptional MerR regulator
VRIGELSARTGASVRSIRYYEKQGLIASARSDSGQRSFGEEAVERVVLIRRLFHAGLNSRTMADLLPCITDPGIRTPYLAQRLREERERILIQVEQLSRTVEALDTVIGDLAQPGPIPSPTGQRGQRRAGEGNIVPNHANRTDRYRQSRRSGDGGDEHLHR